MIHGCCRVPVQFTIGEALRLWQAVHIHFVRDGEPDLSVRQVAILLTVYLEAPPHTVRGLASKLSVSKPVITRALDSMGRHDLVTRRRDDDDRRNVLVQRTVKGALYLERVGDTICALARELSR